MSTSIPPFWERLGQMIDHALLVKTKIDHYELNGNAPIGVLEELEIELDSVKDDMFDLILSNRIQEHLAKK
jgi:hypothetical protein